ncbi:hypothetical protein TNCV_4495951 [Trichonephila clavipes]|nr:hypothetical protein TNCV_4495951 [Trichonephila clavipes]
MREQPLGPHPDQGRGSRVVKVSDRGWLVTSSNPVPLKTRHERERCTLNRLRSQTSSRWSKFPATSLQEDRLKPRLPDLLVTTNSMHATPQTVKFHQTPSPSSDFHDIGLRTVFTVQMPKDTLPSRLSRCHGGEVWRGRCHLGYRPRQFTLPPTPVA